MELIVDSSVPGGGQLDDDGFDPTTELQGLIVDELKRSAQDIKNTFSKIL
jgi:hypothetical protein